MDKRKKRTWSAVYGALPCAILVASYLMGCADPASQAPSAAAPDDNAVLVLTDANFEIEALKSPQPVLVDFWAKWCQPCMEMKPDLQDLAKKYAGRVKVAALNVQENRFTAQRYDVESLPALLLFRDGKIVERRNERQTRDELVQLFESALR